MTPLVAVFREILTTKGVVAAVGLAPAKNPYPVVCTTKYRAVPSDGSGGGGGGGGE